MAQNKYVDDALVKLGGLITSGYILIEIGTNLGGFALLLRQLFPSHRIYTFDKDDWTGGKKYLEECNISYHVHDVFESTLLFDLIRDHPVVLFCDGGHKANEFNFFAPKLKPGDFILAHDYAHDKETFDRDIKDKLWMTDEIHWEQIYQMVQGLGMKEILKDEFNKAVWCCFQK